MTTLFVSLYPNKACIRSYARIFIPEGKLCASILKWTTYWTTLYFEKLIINNKYCDKVTVRYLTRLTILIMLPENLRASEIHYAVEHCHFRFNEAMFHHKLTREKYQMFVLIFRENKASPFNMSGFLNMKRERSQKLRTTFMK